jgi:hypothetical protein
VVASDGDEAQRRARLLVTGVQRCLSKGRREGAAAWAIAGRQARVKMIACRGRAAGCGDSFSSGTTVIAVKESFTVPPGGAEAGWHRDRKGRQLGDPKPKSREKVSTFYTF